MKTLRLMAFLTAAAVCLTASLATAHDGEIGWEDPLLISGTGPDVSYLAIHDDDPITLGGTDYKGWAFIGTQNSGTTAWTGLSIFIFDATAGGTTYDATSVDIIDYSPYVPFTSFGSPSIASYTVGTSTSGHATMDITFSDTIDPGEQLFVQFYTDNTAENVEYFGIGFYPVPEPASGTLVALAGAVVAFIRKRYGFRKTA